MFRGNYLRLVGMAVAVAVAVAAMLLMFEAAALEMHLAVWEAYVLGIFFIFALMWRVRSLVGSTSPCVSVHAHDPDERSVGAFEESRRSAPLDLTGPIARSGVHPASPMP